VAGLLHILGKIEGGLDYDALLASTRPMAISADFVVQVPTIDVLSRMKEGSGSPQHQAQLAMLKSVRKRS
jgi:hypothetical protein